MSDSSPVCPLCGGRKAPGTTTFSADIGSGVVLVRHVRAIICQQCGEEWIDHAMAQRLEAIVTEARAKKSQLEVTDFAAA